MKITTIILTHNEQIHIARAINSVKKISKEIIVVDSFSKDNTIQIAKKLGAKVFKNKFTNYSRQFLWALKKVNKNSEWILRLDADEYLEKELIDEIKYKLKKINKNVTGINFNRKQFFMNKWIKFGGKFPLPLLRIWRKDFATIEDRWMDEHIILNEGKNVHFKGCLVDHNLKNMSFFIDKHNHYASREALDVLLKKYNLKKINNSIDIESNNFNVFAKRFIKNNIYNRLPYIISSFLYFLYRYLILFGFLDGRAGLIYHFFQGFWYRFLVGIKIDEFDKKIKFIKSKKKKICELSKISNFKI